MSGSRAAGVGLAIIVVLAFHAGTGTWAVDSPALSLRATITDPVATGASLTITLFRWSTDAERAPLLAALSAPLPAPAAAAASAGGRAGRGRRGGRGAAPAPTPLARLTTAIKGAPTLGYIWGDGPTGYSIKYAWRSGSGEGADRIVLITDRRLGVHLPQWPAASGSPGESDFTVMEMRLDARGAGEAKTSLTTPVVIDTAANTLALDGYGSAPMLLKVTR